MVMVPSEVVKVFWKDQIPDLNSFKKSVLPYGFGKSYGDSCQNDGGVLIDTSNMNKIIIYSPEQALFRCEAGLSLAAILDFIVPRGWFLPVTPGTKFISVAGAVANDVHGKNHHVAGTFGNHVTQFELLRSTGEKLICSPKENSELFRATIGGLGLTGLITWVEFALKPCPSAFFAMESIKFNSLEEFFEINTDSEKGKGFDYTVSWVDTTATGSNLGRGIYMRGNHASPEEYTLPKLPEFRTLPFPFDAPFINQASVIAFNILWFNKQLNKKESKVVHYDPFFYPLDAITGWNKAYGKNGFLQYQFVVPFGNDIPLITKIMKKVSDTGMSSFLTVLKTFGKSKSPGMLSFPRQGITMAIDFRYNGEKTLNVLNDLDLMVKYAGGVLYPAKDARMSGKDFRTFYPQYTEFSKYIDPMFSSSFWRRVMS